MKLSFAAAIFAALITVAAPSAMAEFEIGVGANYWYSVKEAKDKDFDRDGLGWLISTRLRYGYIGIGLEVEQSPDNFKGDEEKTYYPAAYLILGKGIYAALGIGTYYRDGDFIDDTWYALRAGLEFPLLINNLTLDINANYRVEKWSDMDKDKIDSDTILIGAALRLSF